MERMGRYGATVAMASSILECLGRGGFLSPLPRRGAAALPASQRMYASAER